MNELAEIRALLSAMEKLVDNHPYLDKELQAIYEKELATERRETLKHTFTEKT